MQESYQFAKNPALDPVKTIFESRKAFQNQFGQTPVTVRVSQYMYDAIEVAQQAKNPKVNLKPGDSIAFTVYGMDVIADDTIIDKYEFILDTTNKARLEPYVNPAVKKVAAEQERRGYVNRKLDMLDDALDVLDEYLKDNPHMERVMDPVFEELRAELQMRQSAPIGSKVHDIRPGRSQAVADTLAEEEEDRPFAAMHDAFKKLGNMKFPSISVPSELLNNNNLSTNKWADQMRNAISLRVEEQLAHTIKSGPGVIGIDPADLA